MSRLNSSSKALFVPAFHLENLLLLCRTLKGGAPRDLTLSTETVQFLKFCRVIKNRLPFPGLSDWQVKGPVKAVSGHKITPNRFKTTYRSVLTFEEKRQSIIHLFKTFSGLD